MTATHHGSFRCCRLRFATGFLLVLRCCRFYFLFRSHNTVPGFPVRVLLQLHGLLPFCGFVRARITAVAGLHRRLHFCVLGSGLLVLYCAAATPAARFCFPQTARLPFAVRPPRSADVMDMHGQQDGRSIPVRCRLLPVLFNTRSTWLPPALVQHLRFCRATAPFTVRFNYCTHLQLWFHGCHRTVYLTYLRFSGCISFWITHYRRFYRFTAAFRTAVSAVLVAGFTAPRDGSYCLTHLPHYNTYHLRFWLTCRLVTNATTTYRSADALRFVRLLPGLFSAVLFPCLVLFWFLSISFWFWFFRSAVCGTCSTVYGLHADGVLVLGFMTVSFRSVCTYRFWTCGLCRLPRFTGLLLPLLTPAIAYSIPYLISGCSHSSTWFFSPYTAVLSAMRFVLPVLVLRSPTATCNFHATPPVGHATVYLRSAPALRF